MNKKTGNESDDSYRTSRVPTQPGSEPNELDDSGSPNGPSESNKPSESGSPAPTRKNKKKPLTKLRKTSIAILSIGLAILVAGAGFLVYNLMKPPVTSDADFLVSVKTWQRKDEPSVIWQFTEIGKGTLTTNSGANEYDFSWAFADDKLKIDTDWLYVLNDEYDYSVDQSSRTLTLTSDDQTITFVPANAS